ncbi:MAG: PGF-pre-PGF domain-containing protein, partial [Methanoregula sp.]|nr:PGF-pre-PGF domain-containing protein [Methanoregula sp.]
GGIASDGISSINDVWRLIPAGSSAQNPSHTYTTPGTYQVSLQVYNTSGYDSMRKAGYVTVNNDDYGESYEPPSPSTLSAIDRTITETVNVGGGSVVTRAEMTGSDLGKNLVITAFPRKSLPSGMVTPNTTVYQYISIVSSTIPGVVNQTTLDFSVPQSWLTEHGFTDGDIVMMHYENGQWQTLDTRCISQDGGNVLYRATTPGFSYFAVAYQKGGTTMDNTGTDNPLTTPVTTTVAVLRAPVPDAVSPVPITTEKTPAVPSAPVADRVGGIPLATIIIGTIGALAVIMSTVLVRRWWTRKQNPALFRKYD